MPRKRVYEFAFRARVGTWMPPSCSGIGGDGFTAPTVVLGSLPARACPRCQNRFQCQRPNSALLHGCKARELAKKSNNPHASAERSEIPPCLSVVEETPLANLKPVGVSFVTKPNESLLRCLARFSSDINPPPFTRDNASIRASGPEASSLL